MQVEPTTQLEWAQLAHALGVQVMHISERDTQVTLRPKRRDEFVNTCVQYTRVALRCFLRMLAHVTMGQYLVA